MGNVKALTNDELKFVLSRYEFDLSGNYVVVKANHRKTAHIRSSKFSLLLPLERKRVQITPEAIDLWADRYLGKYSLIEVQNAMSTLAMTLQPVTKEGVKEQLKRTRSRLDNLYREGE